MSKLRYIYSSMNAGKTSNLIQTAFNYKEMGHKVAVLTSSLDDRYGSHKVASRIGLEMNAIPVSYSDSIKLVLSNSLSEISAIFVDEAQFFTQEQIDELGDIVDEYDINVFCYGIRSDFRGELFTGSERLLTIADEITELKNICFCGKKAIMNSRIGDCSGEQVEIGGNDKYVSLCRKHFKEQLKLNNM